MLYLLMITRQIKTELRSRHSSVYLVCARAPHACVQETLGDSSKLSKRQSIRVAEDELADGGGWDRFAL